MLWSGSFTVNPVKARFIQIVRLVDSLIKNNNCIVYTTQRNNSFKSNTMNKQEPVIRISQGLIKGLKRKTIYDYDFYSFEGIPYARPPLGELRFKAPIPAENWSDVKDCQECDKKPVQKNHLGMAEGTEDCLNINVFAKTLDSNEKLPVMIWIYGGAFTTGSGIRTKYSPDYFMQENIILVTFNYRLGALGFLCITDPSCEVPGNTGLKDQVLALKWVKENISFFGGDTNNITVFGESAGGASTHYMTLFEQTKGLFHKAICMSGVAFNPWAISVPTTDLPFRLACEKGYSGPNEDKLVLDYLRTIPAEELVLVDKLNMEAVKKGYFYAFTPCLEPYESKEALITRPLEEMVANSWGNKIPMMIGGTSFEGLVRYSQVKKKNVIQLYNENPKLYFPLDLQNTLTEDTIKKLVPQLKELHFTNNSEVMGFLDYDSFISFWAGIHRLIKIRQSTKSVLTFQYLFDFDSPTFNHHRTMFCGEDIKEGVAHADDLSYLFYAHYSWKLVKDSKEFQTIQRMIKIWTSFAKTCNPNCEFTKDSPWKSVEETDPHKWLRISNEITFVEMDDEFKKKLNFWVNLYEK